MKKCPICDKETSHKEFTTDIGLGSCGPIEEEYETCPDGHYFFEYAYGNYHLSMKTTQANITDEPNFQIRWHYTETPEQALIRWGAVEAFIAYARSLKHD